MDNGLNMGFETSPSTEKLDAALAKAQAEIGVAIKDKTNPAFRSKYADLTSVWEACRSALTKHGISVTQWPLHSTDNRLHIITRLACAGEWMKGHFSIPVAKGDAHGFGSATTYAKRFALAAAVGVVADDDDDGNAASHAGNGNGHAPAPRPSGERITENQARDLEALADEVGANKPAFLKYFNVPTFADIPASMYPAALAALEKKRKAAA